MAHWTMFSFISRLAKAVYFVPYLTLPFLFSDKFVTGEKAFHQESIQVIARLRCAAGGVLCPPKSMPSQACDYLDRLLLSAVKLAP